ncbi:unnamed protein product [Pleuronectes platessa]|uniref:Uncharacterized protein n=1 Tax=Pleuronectes platessa TaxID=8262 RepID=A0A9N7VZH9_PLEPL|nr:unnamed protein product [Pleuronectes platessa]
MSVLMQEVDSRIQADHRHLPAPRSSLHLSSPQHPYRRSRWMPHDVRMKDGRTVTLAPGKTGGDLDLGFVGEPQTSICLLLSFPMAPAERVHQVRNLLSKAQKHRLEKTGPGSGAASGEKTPVQDFNVLPACRPPITAPSMVHSLDCHPLQPMQSLQGRHALQPGADGGHVSGGQTAFRELLPTGWLADDLMVLVEDLTDWSHRLPSL